MRMKKTRSSLLVLAHTGLGEPAMSTRQISAPAWTVMRARVRVTGLIGSTSLPYGDVSRIVFRTDDARAQASPVNSSSRRITCHLDGL